MCAGVREPYGSAAGELIDGHEGVTSMCVDASVVLVSEISAGQA